MSKINPATRLYEDMVKILKDFTVKYSSKADYYETFEVRSQAEDFMKAYEKKDTFFTYEDYTEEEYRSAGVSDEGDIILYMNDRDAVPESIQELVLEKRRKTIIEEYEEQNEYYRMLNGMPPLNTDSKEFIYVPKEYCNKYSIPFDMPVHLIEDELGKFYITLLESNGVIDKLIEENPEKNYLKHLGSKRINTISARRANNFDILYMNTNNVMESIQREFVRSYTKARDYFMSVCYIYEYRNVIQYYDNIIGICIFLMTMQQVSARMISNAQDREFYDDYSIQLLYETYGVPFNKKIDEITQKQIVQNVNILVQNKACDKVLLDIGSILGFESLKIYEYYLMKERQFDKDGRPIIKYTEKFNEKTGKYETVYDYENMYDLHFQRVPIDEKNLVKALQEKTNRVEYLDLITYDPFWWEDDETYHNVWETEYNMIETKYLGITVPYKMTEMLFQSIIQFHMIFDKSDELTDIFIKLPKITESEIRLFDAIILMCALMAKKYHIKGNITDTPSKILSVLEILDRDINKVIPQNTEILKFDFDAFSLKEIEHVKEIMVERLINTMTDEDFENLKEISSDLIFINEEDGSFYSIDGIYHEANGRHVNNVFKNWETGNYYKQFAMNWYLYNEDHELVNTEPVLYTDIIDMVREGTIVHSNENDIIKETLLNRYNQGLYKLNRVYYPTDKSMRESLVKSLRENILSLPDVKMSEELQNRVIPDAEDFLNSKSNDLEVSLNIPRKFFRYYKYIIDDTLKLNNFYKYFDVEYIYDRTNGNWSTEIEPDPLIPPTIPYEDNGSYSIDEVFSVVIHAKSKFNYTKEILENYLVDTSYRIVNGHDIDLDSSGLNNPRSFKKIREVIKDYKVLEEFYSHLTVLSSESLGVTPEEKVEALNKIYENARQLYDFISYHSTVTTSPEEFYAFKKLYETIFFAKETKEKFKVTLGDGTEYIPNTFAEYLQNTNLELYEFVQNIEENSIYLYIDHIIYRLEDLLNNVDYLYILNDEISPLQELLVQLIDFFKSYTTDLVKFSSYMVMDWRMENIIKLFDESNHIGKSIIAKDLINLPYSDFINKYTIRFTLDERLKLVEKISEHVSFPLNDTLIIDDEKDVLFNNKIQTFVVDKPFVLNGIQYDDGFFLLRYNSEKVYKDKNKNYYRKDNKDSLWYYYSKDGIKLRDDGFESDYIQELYKNKQLVIDYGIFKNDGDIIWKRFEYPKLDSLPPKLFEIVNQCDVIAEYYTDANQNQAAKNISLSYIERTFDVIDEFGNLNFYYDENGYAYNKDGTRLPEMDDKFIPYRDIGKAREHIENFMSNIYSKNLIYDEKVIDISMQPLWKIVTDLSYERPKFSSKTIQTNESLNLFDTLDISHGPEEVYAYEDESFFRFESRAWIKYNSEKQKMSNREYSFDELKEEIDSGVLVKKEIYF